MSSNFDTKYRKWDTYDEKEALERVDIAARKDEKKTAKETMEKKVVGERGKRAEILTARENVRVLIAKSGRLRNRNRARSSAPPTMMSCTPCKPVLPPKIVVKTTKSKSLHQAAKSARKMSQHLTLALASRDKAKSLLEAQKYDAAFETFSKALHEADNGGAKRRHVGHRHIPLDWDVDTVAPRNYVKGQREAARGCPHHHHHYCKDKDCPREPIHPDDQVVLDGIAKDSLLGAGESALRLEKYSEAINFLTPILEDNKDDILALLYRGEAFARLGVRLIAQQHLSRCETLSDARDYESEIERLACLVDEEEKENGEEKVEDAKSREAKAREVTVAALIFEREAFYKSATDRFLKAIELLEQDVTSVTVHLLAAAHDGVVRCTKRRHAGTDFNAAARRVVVRHTEAAASLRRGDEEANDGKEEKKEEETTKGVEAVSQKDRAVPRPHDGDGQQRERVVTSDKQAPSLSPLFLLGIALALLAAVWFQAIIY